MDLVALHPLICPSNIYIHYPVCKHVCSYCDFIVIGQSQAKDQFGAGLNSRWISAIQAHLAVWETRMAPGGGEARTIYLGGGTPSLLDRENLERLLKLIRSTWSLNTSAEITMEANPETLNSAYLQELYDLGINRLSIGIQTTRPNQLRRLERLSTQEKVIEAASLAVAHCNNVNLDLMIGIPDQTEKSLMDDLNFISEIQPQHVSVYILTLQPDHVWFKSPVMGPRIADAELVERLYLTTIKYLENLGYVHYEVSNFSKPGFESMHNRNYWNIDSSYLALGPGAHGYLTSQSGSRIRVFNEKGLEKFFESPNGIESFEVLTAEQLDLERLYMKLRTRRPLSISDLQGSRRECSNIERRFQALVDAGLAEVSRDGLILTDRGWLLMEKAAEYLV